MKEHPMTDSTTPEGSNPATDEPGQADATRKQADDRPVDAAQADEETHGAATDAEPLNDSTDGGLEGGDPGVEE
jgi:hypothetical protein